MNPGEGMSEPTKLHKETETNHKRNGGPWSIFVLGSSFLQSSSNYEIPGQRNFPVWSLNSTDDDGHALTCPVNKSLRFAF